MSTFVLEMTYQQNDGVTMGSPLGPVLTDIFMVELETKVIPTVIDSIYHWRRYADDTYKESLCRTCFSAFEFFS